MTHSGLSKVRTKSLTSGSAAPRRDGPCGKPEWGPWGPPGGATTQDVLAAIDDGGVCTLNALPDAIHRGEVDLGYARPGHVKGSENVSFTQLVDRATGAFLPTDELRKHFDEAGALERARVIRYCGGGIAATTNAFVLLMLGQSNVAVYDGSLDEWSRDPSSPRESEATGPPYSEITPENAES